MMLSVYTLTHQVIISLQSLNYAKEYHTYGTFLFLKR